jgi:hypothetical protein
LSPRLTPWFSVVLMPSFHVGIMLGFFPRCQATLQATDGGICRQNLCQCLICSSWMGRAMISPGNLASTVSCLVFISIHSRSSRRSGDTNFANDPAGLEARGVEIFFK